MNSVNNTINLHLSAPDNIQLHLGKTLLNGHEQRCTESFKFRRDTDLYSAAHIFMRQTLSRYAPVAPEDWCFTYNAHGKPMVANPEAAGLQFNLSHTHGMLACAVAQQRPVGVDVEQYRPMHNMEGLCQLVLSPPEAKDVLSHGSPMARAQRFFAYWSLKEAYVKACGVGLSQPLQSITFTQQRDGLWELQDTLDTEQRSWQLLSKKLAPSYYLGLVVQTSPGVKLDMVVIGP